MLTMSVGAGSAKAVPFSARWRLVWLGAAALVAALYLWIIGISTPGKRFDWSAAEDGYYDLLGRAFAGGHLYLPLQPPAELLAAPDRLDAGANRSDALLDAVLYNDRYYLYHGAVPALLLFTPFYALTRHDLPQNLAALLFCLGGFLFLSELFLQAASSFPGDESLPLLAFLLVGIGVASSVPFLLARVQVYEVAIACGYFCLSAAFYFFFTSWLDSRNPWKTGLSGLFIGLAAGCRPHLVLAAVPLVAILLLSEAPAPFFRRFFAPRVLALSLPVMTCGASILIYNYARFNDPFEFGLRYQIASAAYRDVHLSLVNLIPGLYYLLVCPPDLVPEFPFFRLALRQPFDAPVPVLPARYFVEPIAGIWSICPLTLFALAALLLRKTVLLGDRFAPVAAAMLGYTICAIVFLAGTGLTSHRFEVDFLPFLWLLASIFVWKILGQLYGARRVLAFAGMAALVCYSLAANLALGIQGPYDQFVQTNPGAYVRLAGWVSPVARFRPILNPNLRVQAAFEFPSPCPQSREPLLSLGEFGSRHAVIGQCVGNDRIRLISEASSAAPESQIVEVPLHPFGWNDLGLEFAADDLTMTIRWNENMVLRRRLPFLITAPSQVHFGGDPSLGNKKIFDGRIQVLHPPVLMEFHRNPNPRP